MTRSQFDDDLAFGQQSEFWLRTLGDKGLLVEVKTERDKWKKTGNIAIEYMRDNQDSGIAITKARWWVHVLSLDDVRVAAYIWFVDDLKKFLRKAFNGDTRFTLVMGGDNNRTSIILVPIKILHEIPTA